MSVDLRLGDAALAGEEVEVAALVGLPDMGAVHGAIAARVARRRRLPGGAPRVELLLAHMQMNAARAHIDLALVAGVHEGQGAADKTFRRDVQDAGAIARAAH